MPALTLPPLPDQPDNDYRWREFFSLAWLHAVCAPNIAEPLKPSVDNGVDASIEFQRRDGLSELRAQVKSIVPGRARALSRRDHLSYYLSRKRAMNLTKTVGFPVGLLIVVEIPEMAKDWCLRHAGHAEHIKLSSRSWWSLVARDNVIVPPALAGSTTVVDTAQENPVRVDMHHERHLDVDGLHGLLENVLDWKQAGVVTI